MLLFPRVKVEVVQAQKGGVTSSSSLSCEMVGLGRGVCCPTSESILSPYNWTAFHDGDPDGAAWRRSWTSPGSAVAPSPLLGRLGAVRVAIVSTGIMWSPCVWSSLCYSGHSEIGPRHSQNERDGGRVNPGRGAQGNKRVAKKEQTAAQTFLFPSASRHHLHCGYLFCHHS